MKKLDKINKVKTPISDYKRYILKYMRQFWKSENAEIWCGLYTFIKVYTESERLRIAVREES